MTAQSFTFAVDCRQCPAGTALDILTYDPMGPTGVARVHTACPLCHRRWTYTVTLTATHAPLHELHDARATGRRSVA
jgi:hypothetical protein